MKIFLNETVLSSGGEWIPDNADHINDNLTHLLSSLNCFNFHTEPEVYYSGMGLVNLIKNLEILDSFFDYSLTNPIDRLRLLLTEIQARDWDDEKRQKSDFNYYFQSGGGAVTFNVNGTSIAEAAEYKYENHEVALLNLAASSFNETNLINITRSGTNPPNEMRLLSMARVVSKSDTVAYVVKFRESRTYHWSSKHGENGNGVISSGEIVSPLECSRAEAAELLKIAINSRRTDELYCWDSQRSKYMVFKKEYTNTNDYHSYHPINQQEVPDEVKQFLTNN